MLLGFLTSLLFKLRKVFEGSVVFIIINGETGLREYFVFIHG